MRPGLVGVVIVAAAALVGLLSYGVASSGDDRSIASALAKGERPEPPRARLPVLGDGRGERSLDDFRGKVVVVNFWASWCPPCVEELPLLERTQKRIAKRDATILGIDVQDAKSDALRFVRRFGLTYPSLRDANRHYARDFGVSGYPETFVIDRRGRVAAKRIGPIDQAWLDRTLPRVLAERG